MAPQILRIMDLWVERLGAGSEAPDLDGVSQSALPAETPRPSGVRGGTLGGCAAPRVGAEEPCRPDQSNV